jgi:hypothetical protein
MWMCAWLVFIFQKLFSRQTWNLGDSGAEEENEEAIEEKDIKED